MENNTLVKVKDFDEALDDLNFTLNSFKELLQELENKKEILKTLENIDDMQQQITQLKKLIEKFDKTNDELDFKILAFNAKFMQLQEEFKKTVNHIMEDFNKYRKNLTTISSIIEKEAKIVNNLVKKEYKQTLENIKNKLNEDIKELEGKIKVIADELEHIYNEEYAIDIQKLTTQQKITNFLLFLLVVALGITTYKVKKIDEKVNYIQQVTNYNYSVLSNMGAQ